MDEWSTQSLILPNDFFQGFKKEPDPAATFKEMSKSTTAG